MKDDFAETADLDEDAGELRAHGIKRGVVALLGSQYFLALVHEIATRCGHRGARDGAFPIGRDPG